MKKSSPDRVRELLRVMNYLASPIGSEEFLVTKFGMEGIDWIYDERGAPKYTQAGLDNMPAGPNVGPWGYDRLRRLTCSRPEVPEFAKFASAEEKKVLAVGVTDPTLGYYSATDAKTGAQLERLIFDAVSGIAAGRKPMSDLDQLVKDWKVAGRRPDPRPNTKRRSRLSARRRGGPTLTRFASGGFKVSNLEKESRRRRDFQIGIRNSWTAHWRPSLARALESGTIRIHVSEADAANAASTDPGRRSAQVSGQKKRISGVPTRRTSRESGSPSRQ